MRKIVKYMDIAQKRELKQREFILNGPVWEVIFRISLPLLFYNSLNHYFGFFDTLMVAHISSETVSAVAYMNQIQIMVSALGTGLALGGGILTARYIGEGDYLEAQKYSNIMMTMALIVSALLIGIVVPFSVPLLRMANTPEELISVGTGYFRLEIIMMASIFINSVYIAIEKSKGNTKRIFWYNIMVFAIKLSLTAIFVYIMNLGINMVAAASLVAHLSLTIVSIYNLRIPGNMLRMELRLMKPDRKRVWAIVRLAFPIFVQKFVFAFGKVVVNSMSVYYGSMTVGALGVSNRLGGCLTSPTLGIQDGETTIISQNLGNRNVNRALDTFKKSLIFNVAITFAGLLIMFLLTDFLIGFFANGDKAFAAEILSIFKYERIASVTLAVTAAVMGMLYGFGYTKLALLINALRLFAFRIPTLFLLIRFSALGSESVGIAMMVSNGLVGLTAIILGWIVIVKIKKNPADVLSFK